ncbi:MAG TPA: RNase adapter RapZ [Candidatus Sulfobium mesophilum]|jgi:UPF0042 nucleotide-binding protein|nr:RNase adapter RapZ [Candidatus Sulfobium mesophilum]
MVRRPRFPGEPYRAPVKKSQVKSPQFASGKKKSPLRVVIISGLSGSGKTVALRAVEDLNFFCVDNLPLSLIDSLVSRLSRNAAERDIAIGIDIREMEFFSANVDRVISTLKERYRLEVLFLEADTQVLIRRFKETRRPHPLGGDLEAAIQSERQRLEPFKQNADRVIDTSSYSPHQLRDFISSIYGSGARTKDLVVTLTSFGFKYGVPENIDLLFDVRFLPNPFFVPALKDRNGTDKLTAEYVMNNPDARAFMKKTMDLLKFLLPRYRREGKSYLSIAIGCTGGNHRSPAIVEEIARLIGEKLVVNVIHRDIS